MGEFPGKILDGKILESKILDGKSIAGALQQNIAKETNFLQKTYGLRPNLHILRVGKDPASRVYVKRKLRRAKEVGISATEHTFAKETSQEELVGTLTRLGKDKAVHAILLQTPLPKHIHLTEVLQYIAPEKDVDGFHPRNVGLLHIGKPSFVPCTPRGCMILLRHALPSEAGRDSLVGKRALMIGCSDIVGKPLARLLLGAGCTPTIAHKQSKDLASLCGEAEILVVAAGHPGLVKGAWLSKEAVVIDVGINRLEDGSLAGDVEFAQARERVRAITPVPGGVGPMTIACLLCNVLRAAWPEQTIPFPQESILGKEGVLRFLH